MLTKFKQQRLFIRSCCHTHFRNQQHYNDDEYYLSSLCKENFFKQALQAFHLLLNNNTHFTLTLATYAHLILASSSIKSLQYGRRVHEHLLASHACPDLVLNNHILNMYGKCRSLDDARMVFDRMPERNVVSWTSMIAGYSQNHQEEEAVEFYLWMRRAGVQPDQFAFGSLVSACSGLLDVELGRQVHCHVLKSKFGSDPVVQNALVSMYSKFDRIENAFDVFRRIGGKDLISWGSMISGFAQQGWELESLGLFKEMLQLGVYSPNEFLFGSVFSACGGLLQVEHGKQIHGLSIKFGYGGDHFTGCSLCNMYAKCRNLESARNAFSQIDRPDLASWNAIIAGFAYQEEINEAMFLLSQMRKLGLKPDHITIRCLLCACTSSAALSQGQQIHSYLVKPGLDLNISVCNALLTMYAKCSELSVAFTVFEGMKSNKDLVSWNAILSACVLHNQMDNVFLLTRLMHCSEERLDQISIGTVLSACANLATLEIGNQVHGYSFKTGLAFDLSIVNGLIDMYSKCGSLVDARKLFERMKNRDVVSWSSLIVGYAQFGYGTEALELFSHMQHLGVKPNHVTYVGVLSACSRVGLVDEGCHHYKTMQSDHGILPMMEHCSCMVDLFSRAGCLREAESFINQMPFDPDIIVWKSLLAGCRVHENVEVGKRAAENILKLDPYNSAAHVLLCNIYASSGSWNEVANLRKSMKSKGVMKVPGQSWIKIRDQVHVFSVQDQLHLETDEIYGMLGELQLQITEADYNYPAKDMLL
ncbi:hypothetical protein ACLOJK_026693 [Asimina triloba]